MKIAFTGMRPDKLGGYNIPNATYDSCVKAIEDIILKLEPNLIISGMALGVDTYAACVAMEFNIPFIAAIPFEGQEKMWPEKSQRLYKELLRQASKIEYVCDPGYASWKMQRRNEWMVNNSDLLLGIWNGSSGGTANCLKYAFENNKNIYIAPVKDNKVYEFEKFESLKEFEDKIKWL